MRGKRSVRELVEVKAMEGTLLPIGFAANPRAGVTLVKSHMLYQGVDCPSDLPEPQEHSGVDSEPQQHSMRSRESLKAIQDFTEQLNLLTLRR